MITVDAPQLGRREADERNRYKMRHLTRSNLIFLMVRAHADQEHLFLNKMIGIFE